MFLISSIPFAFAVDSTTNVNTGLGITTDPSAVSTSTSASVDTSARAKLHADINALRQERKEREGMKEDFKEERENLKADYKEEAKSFLELRAHLRECKGDFSSDICKEIRVKVKTQAKDHLIQTADKIIELLQRLKIKTDASNIDNKVQLSADIDASIKQVTTIKTNIEGLPVEARPDQLRANAKELKEVWSTTRKTIKLGVGTTVNFGIKNIILQAEKLELHLDTVLAKLKADGKDVSKVDVSVTEFRTHISKAKELAAQAQAHFDAARTNKDNFEAEVKQGQELHVQARSELNLAHKSLRIVVQTLKEIKGAEQELEKESSKDEDTDVSVESDVTGKVTATI